MASPWAVREAVSVIPKLGRAVHRLHVLLISELILIGLHLDFKCSASLAGFELAVQFYSDFLFFFFGYGIKFSVGHRSIYL